MAQCGDDIAPVGAAPIAVVGEKPTAIDSGDEACRDVEEGIPGDAVGRRPPITLDELVNEADPPIRYGFGRVHLVNELAGSLADLAP
jgi:hypothetical protein